MSKIQNETKSQHQGVWFCVRIVVYTMSKIQNETKSQQCAQALETGIVVYTMSKIQNETKSQLAIVLALVFLCCLYYVKDTK